jgi:hypothetical protein
MVKIKQILKYSIAESSVSKPDPALKGPYLEFSPKPATYRWDGLFCLSFNKLST